MSDQIIDWTIEAGNGRVSTAEAQALAILFLASDLAGYVNGVNLLVNSAFRADFERTCEALRIPLHVLPPRKPQWRRLPAQGRGVERANRSARIEFRGLYDDTPHRRRSHAQARRARVLP